MGAIFLFFYILFIASQMKQTEAQGEFVNLEDAVIYLLGGMFILACTKSLDSND